MGYCNILHVTKLLANSLTTATSDTLNAPGSLLEIGRVLKKNLVTEDVVAQYISWADSQINGILSSMYVTPLTEMADWESALYADIDEYNENIILESPAPLEAGDDVIIIEGSNQERYMIQDIISNNVFSTTNPLSFFTRAARVIRVKYPDPIPLISARLATANIYEKYFAAQSEPNESEFGKFLRKLARQEINNILNGRIRLHGEQPIANRWINGNIRSRYSMPNADVGDSVNIDDI